jgi:hypothetical protein
VTSKLEIENRAFAAAPMPKSLNWPTFLQLLICSFPEKGLDQIPPLRQGRKAGGKYDWARSFYEDIDGAFLLAQITCGNTQKQLPPDIRKRFKRVETAAYDLAEALTGKRMAPGTPLPELPMFSPKLSAAHRYPKKKIGSFSTSKEHDVLLTIYEIGEWAGRAAAATKEPTPQKKAQRGRQAGSGDLYKDTLFPELIDIWIKHVGKEPVQTLDDGNPVDPFFKFFEGYFSRNRMNVRAPAIQKRLMRLAKKAVEPA